jgi:hypothetical protein
VAPTTPILARPNENRENALLTGTNDGCPFDGVCIVDIMVVIVLPVPLTVTVRISVEKIVVPGNVRVMVTVWSLGNELGIRCYRECQVTHVVLVAEVVGVEDRGRSVAELWVRLRYDDITGLGLLGCGCGSSGFIPRQNRGDRLFGDVLLWIVTGIEVIAKNDCRKNDQHYAPLTPRYLNDAMLHTCDCSRYVS